MFKFLKPQGSPANDEHSRCDNSEEQTVEKGKKPSDESSLSRLLTEGDLKRKKLTTKLGRLEELNKMIEERIKNLIYQPDAVEEKEPGLSPRLSDASNQLPTKTSKDEVQNSSKDPGKRKKTSIQPAKKGKEPKKAPDNSSGERSSPTRIAAVNPKRKPETLAEIANLEHQASDFSIEKVLGVCKAKVESIDERRRILGTIPVSNYEEILGKNSPSQSISSLLAPNVSILLADAARRVKDQKPSKKKSPTGETQKRKAKNQQQKGQKASQPGTESPKTQINEILKGHAQKISIHSIRSGTRPRGGPSSSQNLLETAQKSRNPKAMLESEQANEKVDPDASKGSVEGLPQSGSVASTKKMQKVIEIEMRTEKTKERDAVEGDSPKTEASPTVKNKDDTEKVETKPKEGEQETKENPQADQKANATDGKEKESELEKRVTYTDRILANRFKKEEPKSAGVVVASMLEKLNSPFQDLKKDNKKPQGTRPGSEGELVKPAMGQDSAPPKSAPVRTPSQSILLSSMIESISKQHNVRVPVVQGKEQTTKPSEQTIRTKSTRSAELKDLVAQAIKDHKIFCIFDNHWYIVRPVREELLSRGWLEVIPERRLIPRRKPPPAGPTVDRQATPDYAIEAILAAKEAFEDDITDLVPKNPPMKLALEKSKPLRKYSDESVKEVYSEFRIVPPSSEKKKNNVDIREFVVKFQNEIQQQGKAAAKLHDKGKDKKGKKPGAPTETSATVNGTKDGLSAVYSTQIEVKYPGRPPLSPSIQAILDSINENKRILAQIDDKDKQPEEKAKDTVDVLFRTTQPKLKKDTTPAPDDSSKGSKFSLSENESKIASRIIQTSNARIQFMWLSIKPAIHLKCFNYSPEIVNKFQKTTFCTKIGLWSHLNNIQWYAHEVHYPAKSPRMYNTGEADDLQAFFQDFQMTACIGMLKWLSETFFDKGIKGVQKKKGKVPIKAFEFAIRQCERYIRFRENEDLNALEEPKVMQEEWNTFLQWFYVITNDHGKVQETSNAQLMVVYTKAVEVLRAMKRHWPEIDVDGRLNIWIMKPYCASCGRGIFMTNNVYYIGQHSKYIVQKYIERPFLIYNTKFDIRQWFMITKLIPLEIWMYKECYLRFCTQPFALRNLHESVHLSNNSVQRKYVSQRDSGLPDQNMWDSNTFQQYLKTIGQPNAWDEIIYPGMRDAIISIMLASQDTFDSQRKSWFEVYGADFMISANLKDGPWLIEINENPAMDPSTKVTARLCPQMLRDVIKVVVDKRANKNALTGQWEMVYRQNYSPSFGTIDIDVKGKRIARVSQSMKTGYSSVSPSSPPFFLSGMASSGKKENLTDKDQEGRKQYEIVKSYNAKKAKGGSEPDSKTKQSFTKTRAKAKLIPDSHNRTVEKEEEAMDKIGDDSKKSLGGDDTKQTDQNETSRERNYDAPVTRTEGLRCDPSVDLKNEPALVVESSSKNRTSLKNYGMETAEEHQPLRLQQ